MLADCDPTTGFCYQPRAPPYPAAGLPAPFVAWLRGSRQHARLLAQDAGEGATRPYCHYERQPTAAHRDFRYKQRGVA